MDIQDVERYRRLRQMFARCGYAGNENGIEARDRKITSRKMSWLRATRKT